MSKLKDKSYLTKIVFLKNKGEQPVLIFPLVFLIIILSFASLLSLQQVFSFSAVDGSGGVLALSRGLTGFWSLPFGVSFLLLSILSYVLFYIRWKDKVARQISNFSFRKEVENINSKVCGVYDGGVKLVKSGIIVDDPKKRQLLKFAGIAVLGFIVPTLFKSSNAQAAYFGSVPGSGVVALKDSTGAKIDPAIKSPTDGYKISEMEDATTSYFGYVNKDGAWYILKDDGSGSFRYTKGNSDFAAQWALRSTTLSYDTFDNVF